jgi:hypothetical protein
MGKAAGPLFLGFQIRLDIAVTAFYMDVLLQGALFRLFEALILVQMALGCFLTAADFRFTGYAVQGVNVALLFGFAAAKTDAKAVAGIRMGMTGIFLLLADVDLIRSVTAILMDMNAADKTFFQAVAAFGVGMTLRFFLGADQIRSKTGILMDVLIGLILTDLNLLIAGRFVTVARLLRFRTDQAAAKVTVDMVLGSIQRTGKLPGKARFRVAVTFPLFLLADQFLQNAGLRMGMGLCFQNFADQNARGAVISVNVLVITAERITGHGNACELQAPEHAQHNKQRKNQQGLLNPFLHFIVSEKPS